MRPLRVLFWRQRTVLYLQAKTARHEEDQETDNQGQESSGDDYSGHCSDSSSSYFLYHLSPLAFEASDASGKEEEEILAAQSECDGDLHDVQDLQGDEACCYISNNDVESTAMSSDQSSVSADHHEGYETDSNYCHSWKSSDEESVGDPDVRVDSCESDNSPHHHEPSTLPLFDGSNKTVLEALAR